MYLAWLKGKVLVLGGARIAPGARRTGNVGTLRALGVPYGTSLNEGVLKHDQWPRHLHKAGWKPVLQCSCTLLVRCAWGRHFPCGGHPTIAPHFIPPAAYLLSGLFINLLCLQKKQAVLSPVRVCRITVRRLLFSGGAVVLILYTAAYQFANLVRVFWNHCVKRYGKRREYVISAHILHKRQPVFCFGAGL